MDYIAGPLGPIGHTCFSAVAAAPGKIAGKIILHMANQFAKFEASSFSRFRVILGGIKITDYEDTKGSAKCRPRYRGGLGGKRSPKVIGNISIR